MASYEYSIPVIIIDWRNCKPCKKHGYANSNLDSVYLDFHNETFDCKYLDYVQVCGNERFPVVSIVHNYQTQRGKDYKLELDLYA